MVSQERLDILNKIKEYESIGDFDHDVENDPPARPLEASEIDYLRKKWRNKIARFFVSRAAEKGINGLIKQNKIIVKNIIGLENLKGIKGSAFITSNHFHPFENMAIYKVFQQYAPKKEFYRVIREGNYTAPPKGFDKFFKYCNTLPLSSNYNTMKKFYKALDVITKKNNYILIYPEQYMWWNYKKPRPFKDGAFRFACMYNRPIIPCFITMEDSKDYLDDDGLPVQEYTLHIMKPIYKDQGLPLKESIQKLKQQNFELCKECYEKVYGITLQY